MKAEYDWYQVYEWSSVMLWLSLCQRGRLVAFYGKPHRVGEDLGIIGYWVITMKADWYPVYEWSSVA